MSNDPFDSNADSPFQSPQHASKPPATPSGEGDGTGGVIPYKNMPALLAYYFGLFSLFPCVGILLAIPALILGIMGLRKRRQNPAVKGSVHAWIGIVMGGIFTLVWGAVIVLGIVAAVLDK